MFRFFKRVIFSRSFMTAMLILLQLAFYIVISTYLFEYSFIIQVVSYVLCAFLAIYILGLKNGSLDVKLPWVIFILLFPVFGSLFYFFFSTEHRGPVYGNLAKIGIWFLMISFGASFGATVMGRISLLIGRFSFLLHDWLGII